MNFQIDLDTDFSFDQALKLQPDNHLAWWGRGEVARNLPYCDSYYQQQFVGLFHLEKD